MGDEHQALKAVGTLKYSNINVVRGGRQGRLHREDYYKIWGGRLVWVKKYVRRIIDRKK